MSNLTYQVLTLSITLKEQRLVAISGVERLNKSGLPYLSVSSRPFPLSR